MKLNNGDLIIETGIVAYEKWHEEDAPNKNISICEETYGAGVLVTHIPTNISIYSNVFKSTLKNKNRAIYRITEIIKERLEFGYYKGEE